MPTLGMIEIFILTVVTFLLTSARAISDMAARAPERRVALRETIGVLAYAFVGQVGGWVVGPAMGYRPFSFHIAGTVFGCSFPPTRAEVALWALYNFLIFAVVPYVYFRRRYTNTQLNLRSTNLQRRPPDLRRPNLGIRRRTHDVRQQHPETEPASGDSGGTTYVHCLLCRNRAADDGADLCDLAPRYLKLTGSTISTVLLGGLTYAAMHIVEGWWTFDSPRNVALSLMFVLFQYFGPGMIKSVLTLRTGNAWVHALSYHAVAPHVLIDTPLMVRAFGIG